MAAAQIYDIGKPYTVIAHHAFHGTSNRMHSDGLPQKLGFRGAFVLGVATYGNMTRALVGRFGEAWLGRAVVEVQFLKPVCEGDRLRIETLPIPGRDKERAFQVTAYNETMANEVAARMQTSTPSPFPAVEPTANLKPNEWEGEVTQRRTWDVVIVDQPYRSLRSTLSTADNEKWKSILEDDLPIYFEGEHPPIHPAHVLRQVQLGSTHQYKGDNAVHGSTKAVIHKMLRVGDAVQVLTVPTAKWDKKGNHWVTIYCAVRTGGQVCAEIFHTQIFKLRGAEAVVG